MSVNSSNSFGKFPDISLEEIEYNLNFMRETVENDKYVDMGFTTIFSTAIVNLQEKKDVNKDKLKEVSRVLHALDSTSNLIRNQRLEQASKEGDVNKMKKLINDGANVDYRGENGNRPLHYACRRGDVNAVKLLLENDANFLADNDILEFPRTIALNLPGNGPEIVELIDSIQLQGIIIREDNPESVKRMLENGKANINYANQYGNTAIHLASAYGRHEVAKLLIEKNANLFAKNAKGKSALQMVKDVKMMGIIKNGLNASLISQSFNDKIEKEKIIELLKEGADINYKDEYGYTPLHAAAWRGNLKAVHVFTSLGADLTILNNQKETPLAVATRMDKQDVVKFLQSVAD